MNSKFHILEISKATPRRDKGQPVRGYIVALRK
jgi:predicted TPR repeat methyltransferase